MKDTLYIPDKIKVGFQKRSDTYTGRLAFVTCLDAKGKLKSEKSWEGWRHKPEDIPRFNHGSY